MKTGGAVFLILVLLLAPVPAQTMTIDSEFAKNLYNTLDLSNQRPSVLAVFAVLEQMDRRQLEALSALLDDELNAAYLYYWQQTRQARESGLTADYSGWQGKILPGVSLEERDKLSLLLNYVQQKLGSC